MQARSWTMAGGGLALIAISVVMQTQSGAPVGQVLSLIFMVLGSMIAVAGFIGLVFAPTMEGILREVRRPRDPEAGHGPEQP